MWNLKNKKNKLIKNRLTSIEDNLVTVGRLRERGEGLKKYKLLIDIHRNGEHGIRNAVSINVMAKWRAGREKEQSGGLFHKLYKCLINVLYT